MTLPVAKTDYQMIVNGGLSTTTSPTIIDKEGYEFVMDDFEYDGVATSCLHPTMESRPSSRIIILRFIWRLITFGLTFMPFILAANYNAKRKIPPRAFFAWTVGTFGMYILALFVAGAVFPESIQPENALFMCNFNDRYRILSFTPNWLYVPVQVVAIALVYFGTYHKLNRDRYVKQRQDH